MPSVVRAVGMVVVTSNVLADVYYRASTLLTNMTYTPSQPHAMLVLKRNKYVGILSIAVTTLQYITISMITIFSMYIAHVR